MRIQWGPSDTGSCKPRSRSSPALRGDTVSRQCNCRKSRFSLLIRGIGHRVSSFETIRTEHYEVPPDFDGNVPLYPYTSGIGPWTRGPQWPVVNARFQCMNITGQANRERQKSTRSRPSDREAELRLWGTKTRSRRPD